MFGDQDGFPFMVGGRAESVTDAHPSTIHILQLWQVYIDNVNPLLKITHVPTIQGQIIQATSRLDRAPKNIEALMFAIYVMAITSLEETAVADMFASPRGSCWAATCRPCSRPCSTPASCAATTSSASRPTCSTW